MQLTVVDSEDSRRALEGAEIHWGVGDPVLTSPDGLAVLSEVRPYDDGTAASGEVAVQVRVAKEGFQPRTEVGRVEPGSGLPESLGQ